MANELKEAANEIYLIIHGHFYQPPRENPFLDAIESQPSAFPYHDWNERIYEECYKPNTASRVLDKKGRISDIVNNFQSLSFNIGPTLSTWLEEKHPDTYKKIIKADKLSMSGNNGRGNAIGQVYHHVIMPLVPKRDKITQVIWGKAYFKKRFKRETEGIWLPEAAVNIETVKVLLEYKIKFTVLSPYQALRIRKIPGGKWINVKDGNIDTTRSYRIYLDDNVPSDKSLAVFFYDKNISKAVAFEHLLKNAGTFAARIKEAVPKEKKSSCLVNICTDGESYGHHEPFGDMCIAYLLKKELKPNNFIVTNYSNFLEMFPPEYEVELNLGEDGEGSSWSCFHGVKRWKDDCGCHISNEPGWNQKWRKPLKKAVDLLSEDLSSLFEKEGSKFVSDPWEARNDYGNVVINNWSGSSMDLFFEKHLKSKNDRSARIKFLNLLESQRYSMMMYTSCGWFFDDIEGIEAIQNLKFAAKAAELVKEFIAPNFILPFVNELKNAIGNKSRKSGKDIFFLETNPYLDVMKKVANQMVLENIFFEAEQIEELYGYRLKLEEITTSLKGRIKYYSGKAKATSVSLGEEFFYIFICIQRSEFDLKNYLLEIKDIKDFLKIKEALSEILKESPDKIEPHVVRLFKSPSIGIKDLFPDERKNFLLRIATRKDVLIRKEITEFFENNKALFTLFFEGGVSVPPAIRTALEYNFSTNLLKETDEFLKSPDTNSPSKLKELIDTARKIKLNLDISKVLLKLSLTLEEKVKRLVEKADLEKCTSIKFYMKIIENLSLEPSLTESQNILFEFLNKGLPSMIESLYSDGNNINQYEVIAAILRIAENLNLDTDSFRKELKPFENKLIELPRFWP